ncbi:MAG TPA: cytochrome P450 [Nocardioidaceae bacterium]|nr:cytochrome P450 [Nocardioidaceae bacterium]
MRTLRPAIRAKRPAPAMTAADERFARRRPTDHSRLDREATRHLPPGPRWPSLLQTVALIRFRHWFVPAMHARYGDVFTVRILPRRQPLVLFTRPEHVKEIFAGDPEVFHAGEGNAILGPVMGEHSLLLLDGPDHQRTRRLLMPAFHGAALRGYQRMVAELARAEVSCWTPDVPFRSLDRMNALALEVILRVVFGVSDEARLARLRPLVNRTVDVSPLVLLGGGHRLLRRLDPWRAMLETQRALDEVIFAEIAERRCAPDLATRTDVLSRLLTSEEEDGLTDQELRDQLATLLLAGHETTATALSWSLYELARDAGQLAAARSAAVRGDTEHLEAVLKESMRLHTVIPMVVRRLRQPATIGGVDLPRGVNTGPSILLTHARVDTYGDPEVFRPQRFLDGEVRTNTWIPFGGGVRRCIGAGFSLMEGVAVLREVLLRHELSLPEGTVDHPKVRNITSVPWHGARIVVRPLASRLGNADAASLDSGPDKDEVP